MTILTADQQHYVQALDAGAGLAQLQINDYETSTADRAQWGAIYDLLRAARMHLVPIRFTDGSVDAGEALEQRARQVLVSRNALALVQRQLDAEITRWSGESHDSRALRVVVDEIQRSAV